MDSLLIALLIGVLAEFGDTLPTNPELFAADSITITVSVQITGTVEYETETPDRVYESWEEAIRTSHARPLLATSRSPVRALRLRGAFGLPRPVGEDVGYISVADRNSPGGWTFRLAVLESLDTSRERNLRFSLVHGLL